ncbi:alpha/beta fold hydrolase [Cupriavidus metallidurans]|uniref:YheT family hydrolase n=1 Tax=Cupriavidus TaxID=106589 RepID=UPI000E8E104B|nr:MULTISPECIES: alpha/beta fold hydrolase [Cupriavidus]HBD39348.1 alpha/beta hydrolase [Cupriavidus sp.]HBO79418.1 alpha/beta hydrolase [Cupriavidus sp.]
MLFGEAFQTPWWLRGGHAQTILPARFTRHRRIVFRRERWDTPDGDFIDLDWTTHPTTPGAPLVVMFHGLEGDSRSHYAQTLMAALRERGWQGVIPHFRGCSGELNIAPRFYHSGDSAEIRWVLERVRNQVHTVQPGRQMLAVGISLGGNALLRYLGEEGRGANFLSAAAAVSAPLDLAAGGAALSSGFNMIYTRMFLQTLKRKSLAKLEQFPGLYDRETMLGSRDLYAFDNVVTAPLHGFRDTDDYWARASSKPILGEIRIPTLVLNARNDPFLPSQHLPGPREVSDDVLLEQPEHGGHVGFMTPREGLLGQLPLLPFAGHIEWLPTRILDYFDSVRAARGTPAT